MHQTQYNSCPHLRANINHQKFFSKKLSFTHKRRYAMLFLANWTLLLWQNLSYSLRTNPWRKKRAMHHKKCADLQTFVPLWGFLSATFAIWHRNGKNLIQVTHEFCHEIRKSFLLPDFERAVNALLDICSDGNVEIWSNIMPL